MLFEAVVLAFKEPVPTATLDAPVVLLPNEPEPTATLSEAVVLASSA